MTAKCRHLNRIESHRDGVLPSTHPQQHCDAKNAVMVDGTLKDDAIFAVTLAVGMASYVMPLFIYRTAMASLLMPH